MTGDGAPCPLRVNAPRHPAEQEAWRIANSAGCWRPMPHPRFAKWPPLLDWAGARSAADLAGIAWSQVRPLLMEIEAGALEGHRDDGVMIDIEEADNE